MMAAVIAAHDARRGSGLIRLLGILVLLFAVAAMHAGAFTTGPGVADPGGRHTVAAGPTVAVPTADPHQHDPHDHSVREHGCPCRHAAAHRCVFVLSAAAGVAGLVLVSWLGAAVLDIRQSSAVGLRVRQRHPPPCLDELSILRI
jgi:hypothetical protein